MWANYTVYRVRPHAPFPHNPGGGGTAVNHSEIFKKYINRPLASTIDTSARRNRRCHPRHTPPIDIFSSGSFTFQNVADRCRVRLTITPRLMPRAFSASAFLAVAS